uniref:Uncharacterized protein n=1 Tax=Anguilla anguilla TaxID=7936 RepID=A0A0E9Q4Z1_ANGAN
MCQAYISHFRACFPGEYCVTRYSNVESDEVFSSVF